MNKFFLISFLTTLGFASDIDVPPNVTTTQTLTDDGDTLTVASDGSIIVAGNAVEMNNTNQTATNAGTISTTLLTGASGIVSTASSATITNTGTISTTGNLSYGIFSSGANATISNGGTITTSSSTGILSEGASCTISNSGTISSFNDTIRSNAATCTIYNSGTIVNTGSWGIFISGADANVQNTGAILSANTSLGAIFTEDSGTNINNSGTILCPGVNRGIYSQGASTFVTNSGKIKSVLSYALQFEGANPTLSLLLGSNIEGPITSLSPLNVIVQEGLNLRLTIDDASNGFGFLNIGSPYITVGNTETLAVVDRTGLALQADVLEDLSDSVLDSIYRRRFFYLHCCKPHCGYWGEAIGAYRKRTNNIHYQDWVEGGLAGLNWEAFCGSIGLFGGGTYGRAQVAGNTQRAEISTGLGGLTYEQMYRNIFLGFALTSGYVNWDNRRTVMNNLAPAGEQNARANVNGWMISPEIQGAGWLTLGEIWSVLVSSTFRYAGLFLGDYSESGSGADLSVNDRQVDLLKIRGELALSGQGECGCFCWNFEPYIGVAGRFQVGGNTVDGAILDQGLSFYTGGPRNLAEFLFGIRGEERLGKWTLFGNVQGLFDNYNSSRVLAELGLNRIF